MTPTLTFIIVLLIGIIVGIAAQRMARASWLSRQIAGGRRADLTSALVGIAGAFIGFHIAALVAADHWRSRPAEAAWLFGVARNQALRKKPACGGLVLHGTG